VVTMRELRTELMRSAAPVAALATLVVYVLTMLARTTWDTGWSDLSTSVRSFLILLIPVAAAAGAWQGGRERRARIAELMATVPRSPWQRIPVPIVAVVLAVVATLALAVATTGVVTGPGTWQRQLWPVVTVAVGLLAVAAAAAVGAGLGRLVRTDLVAPIILCLSALVLVVLYGRASGLWVTMYNPAMSQPQDLGLLRAEFQQVRPGISAGQAIWLGGLFLTGMILAAATTFRSRLLAAAPAVAGALLALPFFVAPGYHDGTPGGAVAYGPDARAMALYCAPGALPVCGAKVHEQHVRLAAASAREVLVALQRLPGAPARAVEDSVYLDTPVPDDVLPISGAALKEDKIDRLRILAATGLGVHPTCGDLPGPVFQDTYEASALAGAWLLDTDSTAAFGDYPSLDGKLRSFRKLAPKEQVRRMVALRTALRHCRPGAMAILTGAAR
jgi:hypothetical protein